MRPLTWAAASALLLGLLLGPLSATAHASGCPAGTFPAPGDGSICIPASDPGAPGGSGDGSGSSGGTSGPSECRTTAGAVVPCTHPAGGYWSAAHQCYLIDTEQPPASDPVWQGNSPEDGRVYLCVLPLDQPGTPTTVFVANGEAPVPDPAVLAQSALDEMALTRPDVGLAPGPPGQTYVGVETWLWLQGGQWETLSRSVTAGRTTVSVTATPQHVEWSTGPGAVRCDSPGREWRAGQMSSGDRTSCLYVFERTSTDQPSGAFTVSATIGFAVEWTCSGVCLASGGSLGLVDGPAGSTSVRVGERQSVTLLPSEGSR